MNCFYNCQVYNLNKNAYFKNNKPPNYQKDLPIKLIFIIITLFPSKNYIQLKYINEFNILESFLRNIVFIKRMNYNLR